MSVVNDGDYLKLSELAVTVCFRCCSSLLVVTVVTPERNAGVTRAVLDEKLPYK